MTAVVNMAASESEEIDVTKEFNLLPIIFETIQALQKTNDPQEFTKKVSLCFLFQFREIFALLYSSEILSLDWKH